jgi:hypothetical protein
MSRLATLLINIVAAIRAFFTRAAPGPRPISPTVRSFVLAGHANEIRASLVEQIEQYEAAGAISFTLQYPGGYYVIRGGQIVESGRGE